MWNKSNRLGICSIWCVRLAQLPGTSNIIHLRPKTSYNKKRLKEVSLYDTEMFPFPPSPWQRNEHLSILSEVSRQPKGAEWLWHPKMVVLYKLVLQSSDSNSTCREAAIGALQNITAGEARVRFHTS